MKNLAVILLLIIFCCADCRKTKEESETCHHAVTILNSSTNKFCFAISSLFPDTLMPCPLGNIGLASNEKYDVLSGTECWEDYVNRIKYFQVFIVDKTICDSNPCDSIRENNLILKRYQLSLEDLKATNWIVTYP